ncbi:MAG: AI-2E family transporter [Clostridia bacterium]|nr:AI-2E family transporter [Clostridia bacterium]
MNFDKYNTVKTLLIIVFAVAVYTAFQNIDVILRYIGILFSISVPFIIGGVIAFVLNIPMKAIEKMLFEDKKIIKKEIKKSVSRPVSLIISIILVIIVISAVINIVVPQLVKTFYSIGNNIYAFVPDAIEFFQSVIKSDEAVNIIERLVNIDWKTILNYVGNFLKSGGSMLNSTIGVVSTIFSTTVNIIIGFIFALYILLQKEKLSVQAIKIMFSVIPEKIGEKVLDVAKLSYKTFSNFVTGQCLEACILGTMFFIVLSILRMPYSLLIGVLIAFTALIPIVGAFIGCIISALLILMINPLQSLIFIAVFLIIQQIEGNLIYPHVVGNSVGLPSIWVLVAVTIGGNLFGITGMLLFIPLSSVLYTLFRKWVNKRIVKNCINIDKYIN